MALYLSTAEHIFKNQVGNTWTQSWLKDQCWSSLRKENIKKIFCNGCMEKKLKIVMENLEKETMENVSSKTN